MNLNSPISTMDSFLIHTTITTRLFNQIKANFGCDSDLLLVSSKYTLFADKEFFTTPFHLLTIASRVR